MFRHGAFLVENLGGILMKVGRMRYRIIIQRPSDETDGFADPKDEWSDLAILLLPGMAAIMPYIRF